MIKEAWIYNFNLQKKVWLWQKGGGVDGARRMALSDSRNPVAQAGAGAAFHPLPLPKILITLMKKKET